MQNEARHLGPSDEEIHSGFDLCFYFWFLGWCKRGCGTGWDGSGTFEEQAVSWMNYVEFMFGVFSVTWFCGQCLKAGWECFEKPCYQCRGTMRVG